MHQILMHAVPAVLSPLMRCVSGAEGEDPGHHVPKGSDSALRAAPPQQLPGSCHVALLHGDARRERHCTAGRPATCRLSAMNTAASAVLNDCSSLGYTGR